MRRVLVVIDDPAVRDLLAQFLSSVGLAVHTARSGAAALTQLQRLRIDAVVCGGAMIDLDPDALVAQLRAAGPHLGVVVLYEGPEPAPRAGVIALAKPVRLPRLHAALLEVTRRGVS